MGFPELLSENKIRWRELEEDERMIIEREWRGIYGDAFRGRPRMRHGIKAEHEYSCQVCDHFWIIPFSQKVPGTHVYLKHNVDVGFECHGRLPDLSPFHSTEFFVSPPDLSWTMVFTHEDYGFGGPYFIRVEWR